MKKFTLNIKFESADLTTIYKAKQRIVISKQNQTGINLAWITFRPFQNNKLEWTDDYALYCSNAEISSGVKIKSLSDINSQPGIQHVFKDGYFSALPENPVLMSNESYHVRNEMEGFSSLVFGLAQGISINGKQASNNPISAIIVPYMQKVSFAPHEVVDIFLEADIDDSVVVDNARNKPITIAFGQEIRNVDIRYCSDRGAFSHYQE